VPLTVNASANFSHAETVGLISTFAVNVFTVEKQLDTPIVTETGWPSSAVAGVTLTEVKKPSAPQQRVHWALAILGNIKQAVIATAAATLNPNIFPPLGRISFPGCGFQPGFPIWTSVSLCGWILRYARFKSAKPPFGK
jgi:hypothetical protein